MTPKQHAQQAADELYIAGVGSRMPVVVNVIERAIVAALADDAEARSLQARFRAALAEIERLIEADKDESGTFDIVAGMDFALDRVREVGACLDSGPPPDQAGVAILQARIAELEAQLADTETRLASAEREIENRADYIAGIERDIGQLLTRAKAAESRAEVLTAALQAVEWMCQDASYSECPWCGNSPEDRHKADCQRQEALGAGATAPEGTDK